MADAGFGTEIGRDDDALRWALATADVVSEPGDWAATPVPGQRAVTIAPGQGQAAQITMPEIVGAKTEAQIVPLAAPAVMTHAGRLICRELLWYGIEQSPPGESRFVVLDAGDFSAFPSALPDWRSLVSTDPATGFVRLPGQRYLVPLHYAVVSQTNEVRLWDLRRFSPNRPRAGGGEEIGTWSVPWGPGDAHSGTFRVQPDGNGGSAGLVQFSIPDPGCDFEAIITAGFAAGDTVESQRLDFAIGYGGASFDGPLGREIVVVPTMGETGLRWRPIASARTGRLSGALTWRLIARRVGGGSADGIIESTARYLQIQYVTPRT